MMALASVRAFDVCGERIQAPAYMNLYANINPLEVH